MQNSRINYLFKQNFQRLYGSVGLFPVRYFEIAKAARERWHLYNLRLYALTTGGLFISISLPSSRFTLLSLARPSTKKPERTHDTSSNPLALNRSLPPILSSFILPLLFFILCRPDFDLKGAPLEPFRQPTSNSSATRVNYFVRRFQDLRNDKYFLFDAKSGRQVGAVYPGFLEVYDFLWGVE